MLTCLPLMPGDELPLQREFLTVQSCTRTRRTFTTIGKQRGADVLPCGTPDCMIHSLERLSLA